MLGPDTSSYLGTGEHRARVIAANGIRLVLDEHRTTTTPTLKSGQPGKTRVTYGDVDDASRWLWKFVEGAKTAGELYGRTLVVFAAQHYASQLALPTSQRRPSVLPASRKDVARKAFEKIAKPALPASHGDLARAIEREARDYDSQQAKPANPVGQTANRAHDGEDLEEQAPVDADQDLEVTDVPVDGEGLEEGELVE